MKITYEKLVRDKIPQIIENDNKSCKIRILEQEEYTEMLKSKLLEECKEYLESGEVEELADVLEVVHALIKNDSHTFEEVEIMRQEKAKQRGGFKEHIFLEYVEVKK